MTQADSAVELARAEIENRTFAVTRQYLVSHDVVTDADGVVAVARVDHTTEVGAYHVYFGLRDVPYHCVVVIRPTGAQGLGVSGVYIQAAIRVYLAIRSLEVSPEEVTHRVGLQPTRTRLKGSPLGRGRVGRASTEHLWALDIMPGVPGGLTEKLSLLIDLVEPVVEAIATLQPACKTYLTVVYEGWAGDPQFGSIHLDAKSTGLLADARAGVDIDLYAFGPRMAEDGPVQRA